MAFRKKIKFCPQNHINWATNQMRENVCVIERQIIPFFWNKQTVLTNQVLQFANVKSWEEWLKNSKALCPCKFFWVNGKNLLSGKHTEQTQHLHHWFAVSLFHPSSILAWRIGRRCVVEYKRKHLLNLALQEPKIQKTLSAGTHDSQKHRCKLPWSTFLQVIGGLLLELTRRVFDWQRKTEFLLVLMVSPKGRANTEKTRQTSFCSVRSQIFEHLLAISVNFSLSLATILSSLYTSDKWGRPRSAKN